MQKTLLLLILSLLIILIGILARPAFADAPFVEIIEVKDQLFEKIALCESGNNPKAKSLTSSAKGRFQFLDGTWKHYGQKLWGDDWVNKDPFDYDTNTQLAWYVYTTKGVKDWLPSSKCWSTLK